MSTPGSYVEASDMISLRDEGLGKQLGYLFIACIHVFDVCICLHACETHTWKLKLTSGVFLDHFPLYSLRQGLSLDQDLTIPSRLGSHLAQVILFRPSDC